MELNMSNVANHSLVDQLNSGIEEVMEDLVVDGGNGTEHQSKLRPFLLTTSKKIVWTVLFSVMVMLAVIGNLLVMWVILAHRRMKTVTNYFLLNLAVADLMMAIFNVIFNYIYMIDSNWLFGTVYCTINNCIANVTVCASVFSIVAICLDRFIATVKINEPRLSKIAGFSIIVCIWIISFVLAIPAIVFSRLETIQYRNGRRHLCLLQWPDGPEGKSKFDYMYNIVFWQFTYVLPVICMAFTYGLITYKLWHMKDYQGSTQRNVDIIRGKKKVIRMFMVMVFMFAICWLPYHIFFIYKHHNTSILETSYIQHVYLAFYWLAMSNAVANPIIYYWMNAKFREYFKIAVYNTICKVRCTSVRY